MPGNPEPAAARADGIAGALNAALTAFGKPPWSLAEVRGRVRASLRDTFPGMFGEAWEQARDVFYEALERTHLQHIMHRHTLRENLKKRDARVDPFTHRT